VERIDAYELTQIPENKLRRRSRATEARPTPLESDLFFLGRNSYRLACAAFDSAMNLVWLKNAARREHFRGELLMARSSWGLLLAALASASLAPAPAHAVVTPRVLINFNGTLTGAAYNLAPGEIDDSFSFGANGSATVSGGLGDIPGDVDPPTTGPGNVEGLGTTTGSGFYFYGNLLGGGSLTTQNWITEALVRLDVPVNSQPATFNHFLDVQGDTFYRFDSPPNKITRFGYWDGSSEPTATSPGLSSTNFSHVALVWNAASSSLEGFLNGVSQGVLDANAFDVSSPRVGYGFFARFYNRGIDGKLDGVAFSTFTGAFNGPSDFQLDIVVPEPSCAALGAMALGALALVRRKS
jgi:hypothetical protein